MTSLNKIVDDNNLTLENTAPENDTYIDDIATTNITYDIVAGTDYYGLDIDNDGEVDLYAELVNGGTHFDLKDNDGVLHGIPLLNDVDFWENKDKDKFISFIGVVICGTNINYTGIIYNGTNQGLSTLFKLLKLLNKC
tara:strand:+ start:185 stop:598 length:414 start_codon:yes stop_codon:yes gene_type:complete